MVRVVDAPCGAGKTEWAISYMNAHPGESFIFVTPFLSEIERVKEKTTQQFYEPENFHRSWLFGGEYCPKTKIDDLNDLLATGRNIATTHTTFANATDETISILMSNPYNLILDETVDVFLPLSDLPGYGGRRITKGDVKLLLENELIWVDERCRVHWCGGNQVIDGAARHGYSEIERYARNNTLLLIDNKFFLWEFPEAIFKAMESITVLTYRFDGSYLCPYMGIHGMQYEKYSVSGTYGQGFDLVPYDAGTAQRKKWKELITFCVDEREYGMLSATWFQRCIDARPNSLEAKELRNGLRRFFRCVDANPSDVMWTAPKNSRDAIAPKSYKLTRALTEDEMRGRDQEQLDNYIDAHGLRCWVASNARATNRFSDRHVLAYMLNLNPNPEIVKSFAACGIPFSRDEFALSGLIQWVWRSAIRKGEPITLYIPSQRMYRLFSEWLDGER